MPNAVWASIRPSPVMTRSAPREPGVEVGRLHDEVDARAQRERARTGPGSPAARTRRRRPRRHPACRAHDARLPLRGGPRRPRGARRAPPPRPGSRPSAGRRSRPRRTVRGAGSYTSQATCTLDARRDARSSPVRSTAPRRGPRSAEALAACPAPPSVVALPPIPSVIRADAGVEGRTEDARRSRRGRRIDGDRAPPASTRDSPDASASSTTASFAVVGAQPARLDRARRAGRSTVVSPPLPAAGRGDRLERALAAVRERAEEDRRRPVGPATSRRRAPARPRPRSATP